MKTYTCGIRGCAAQTKRRGKLRYCAQKAIIWDKQGRGWCFYHNPENPHGFGERAKPALKQLQDEATP